MAQAAGQGNTGAYSTGSVFGADADLIRQQIEQQAQQGDVALATAPNLNMGVVLGSQAGRAAGNFIAGATGYVDPRVREANAMQEAAREVDSNGYSLMKDPTEYYKAAYVSLTKRGLYDAAGKVHDIMVQQQAQQNAAETARMVAQGKLNTSEAELRNSGKGRFVTDASGKIVTDSVTGTQTINNNVPTDPKSAQGKIQHDYEGGVFGPPGSPEAVKARDDALAKANNVSDPATLAALGIVKGMALQQEGSALALKNQVSMEAMRNSVAVLNETRKRSSMADDIVDGSDAIINTVTEGRTVTGSMFNLRNTISNFVNLVSPELADDVNKTLKIDGRDTSTLDYANSLIVSGLAKELAGDGDRLGKTTVDLFKGSNAAVSTPQGLYVVANLRKAAALRDKAIHDELAKWLAPREGENTSSDSYINRQQQADVKRNELQTTFSTSMFLPKDLTKKAKEAVELARTPFAPLDIKQRKEGTAYRSPATGEKVIWQKGSFYRVTTP